MAFRVVSALTQDPDIAERAVIAAFVHLVSDSSTTPLRHVRAEVLDAVRRCARALTSDTEPARDTPLGPRPTDVYRISTPAVRDALALAVAGRCTSAEIAEIMGLDTATVRRHLSTGLRQLVALLNSVESSH